MEQYIAPKDKKYTITKNLNIVLSVLIVVLLIILLCLLFIWSPMTVVGDSMNNTLNNGDHIFLEKIYSDINYGDIIIFNKPNSEEGKKVIKRVIALPGDYIKFDLTTRTWYRNNIQISEPYATGDYAVNYISTTTDIGQKLVSSNGLLIKDNEVFVLGDNRNISNDSHIYGAISQDLIIGKYIFSY